MNARTEALTLWSAFCARSASQSDCEELRPRDECLHARQKLLPAGDRLLGGKLGLRNPRLVRHVPSLGNTLYAVSTKLMTRGLNQCFPR